MVKKTYSVTGMDCDSCAKMIELDLEDAGITATCDFAKELLEIEYKSDKSVENKVKQIVERGGYQISQK